MTKNIIKAQVKTHDSMMKAMGFPTLSELLGTPLKQKKDGRYTKKSLKHLATNQIPY